MSQRELKEAFVSDLTGTSVAEVALGSLVAPACVLNRGLVLVALRQAQVRMPPLWHLLLDFSLLVLPLVLSCTVLSSALHLVVMTLTFAPVCVVWFIHRMSRPPHAVSTFLSSQIQFQQVPFVTAFRVLVNVQTAISILAVDFDVFPRRFAKTETYGTGVMDFGVGAFVFANALVCPEARGKSGSVLRRVLSAWPLVLLGLGRVVGIKATGYQEHVTEYGVHWNFFFTLAVVRAVASVLLWAVPPRHSLFCAMVVGAGYQLLLETTALRHWIMDDTNRHTDLIHANKEGLLSALGSLAVYLAGIQVGVYVMRPRGSVGQWVRTLLRLLAVSLLLYGVLWVCQVWVEPVSRRLANLSFCVWSVAQSLLCVSCLGLVDIVLLFSSAAAGSCPPPSWVGSVVEDDPCLLRAVHRNQLLFFIVANVTTGLVNTALDTLHCGSASSLCVLLMYMFSNCGLVHTLHLHGITLKYW